MAELKVGRHRLPSSAGQSPSSGTSTELPTTAKLGQQAARGASVVVLGQASRIVIQIGSVAALARLLDPVDYGLVAIVLAIVGVGEIVRDFGLSTAAVQAKSLTTEQRDKLLWLNTAIGAGLAVLGVAAAHLVADIFGQPQLVVITQALSLTFLINGMTAQYRADLNRRMRFRALVGADVAAQIVGVVVALIIAWAGAGYWALVGQQLSQALATLTILAVCAGWLPGRPRRGVDVKSMVRFGHGLMATQFIGYLNNNVDTYTIGLTLGPGPLGERGALGDEHVGHHHAGTQLDEKPGPRLALPARPTGDQHPLAREIAEHRAGRSGHGMVYPPSTGSAIPITNDAASEHSQSTAAAISAGSAIRPIGCRSATCFSSAGSPCIHSPTIRDLAVPGQIALTRMPCPMHSSAAHFVRPSTPCLAAT